VSVYTFAPLSPLHRPLASGKREPDQPQQNREKV